MTDARDGMKEVKKEESALTREKKNPEELPSSASNGKEAAGTARQLRPRRPIANCKK